jgi:N-acetylglutamate synthase-like GNAT family acetyltransferase
MENLRNAKNPDAPGLADRIREQEDAEIDRQIKQLDGMIADFHEHSQRKTLGY